MDIPPDLTSELSKAFETAIGKIAQSVVPTIAGAIATWMLKGEWQRLHTRPRRGFWAPFFKDKLVVVIGKFTGADVPAATSFEASGLVGTGDLFAFGALIASFHTVGQPAPAVAGGEARGGKRAV